MTNNALSIPTLLLVTSITLSTPAPKLHNNVFGLSRYSTASAVYQTGSLNPVAQSFINNYRAMSFREKALQLYGVQCNYTKEEQESYDAMLEQHSKSMALNLRDFYSN